MDHTDRMIRRAGQRLGELEKEDLCGFIFMNGSPSSGMERVKVYGPKGVPVKNGVGIFARAFMDHFPMSLSLTYFGARCVISTSCR